MRSKSVVHMGIVLAYQRARKQPCWVVHTEPKFADDPYGGMSAELVTILHHEMRASIKLANGEVQIVPIGELSIDLDLVASL